MGAVARRLELLFRAGNYVPSDCRIDENLFGRRRRRRRHSPGGASGCENQCECKASYSAAKPHAGCLGSTFKKAPGSDSELPEMVVSVAVSKHVPRRRGQLPERGMIGPYRFRIQCLE